MIEEEIRKKAYEFIEGLCDALEDEEDTQVDMEVGEGITQHDAFEGQYLDPMEVCAMYLDALRNLEIALLKLHMQYYISIQTSSLGVEGTTTKEITQKSVGIMVRYKTIERLFLLYLEKKGMTVENAIKGFEQLTGSPGSPGSPGSSKASGVSPTEEQAEVEEEIHLGPFLNEEVE